MTYDDVVSSSRCGNRSGATSIFRNSIANGTHVEDVHWIPTNGSTARRVAARLHAIAFQIGIKVRCKKTVEDGKVYVCACITDISGYRPARQQGEAAPAPRRSAPAAPAEPANYDPQQLEGVEITEDDGY